MKSTPANQARCAGSNLRWVSAACLVGVLTGLTANAFAAEGEYWEVTSKMEMAGMPFAMPATTVKVCMPKGQERDPRHSTDKECVVTDLKNSGNKTTWKMQCSTKDGVMNGEGESSGTPDSAEGKMRLTGTTGGQKIDMTQTFRNQRIGGACDPDEMKKKVAEMQAAADRDKAKMCDTTGFTTDRWLMSAHMFAGEKPTCPGKKEALCGVVKRDVMRNVSDYLLFLRTDQTKIAATCGLPLESIKRSVCSSIDAGKADIRKQFESREAFATMQAECPSEMKVYAEVSRKRYCEGRSFTAKQKMSLEQCLRSAGESEDLADEVAQPAQGARKKAPAKANQEASASPASAPAAPADSADKTAEKPAGSNLPGLPEIPPNMNPAGAILDGAKKLKGLFGF